LIHVTIKNTPKGAARRSREDKHIIAMYTDRRKAIQKHKKRKAFLSIITKKDIPITNPEVATSFVDAPSRSLLRIDQPAHLHRPP
jgi:hypothetical protein